MENLNWQKKYELWREDLERSNLSRKEKDKLKLQKDALETIEYGLLESAKGLHAMAAALDRIADNMEK